MPRSIDVVVEVGAKRVFASAVDWPGWARAGKDEEAALASLAAYGPRYRLAVAAAAPDFTPPANSSSFRVVERLTGTTSTDFGVPAMPAPPDDAPVGRRDLDRLLAILEACWGTFDAAVSQAAGATLRTGPRGGGRTVDKIEAHVREAERAYVGAVGGKAPAKVKASRVASDAVVAAETERDAVRQAFVTAVRARANGELPDQGPRGGRRWSARYAVRRSAWHALDHAWEIEDRR